MTALDIRAATRNDAPELSALLAACGLQSDDIVALDDFLVARDGAELAGAVGLEISGDFALLRSLAVTPARRGSGLGEQLLASAEQLARARGVRRIYLLTTTAQHFFSRRGYADVPRASAPAAIAATRQFSALCPVTSAFMIKPLKSTPLNVLFLCTGNSARSILAEAALNRIAPSRFAGYSAGSQPKGAVHPLALELLRAQHIAVDGLRSKSWDEFAGAGAPRMDFIFTVCGNAAGEACPLWPGRPATAHWGVPDPAAVEGTPAQKQAAFAQAWQSLSRRIERFVALPLQTLGHEALQSKLEAIGRS